LKKAVAILEAASGRPGRQCRCRRFGDVDPAGRLTATFPRAFQGAETLSFNTGVGFGDFKGNYADAPSTHAVYFGWD
jgi:hypothetical protein